MKETLLIFLLEFTSTLLMADNTVSASKCLLCHDKNGRTSPAKVNQTLAQWGVDKTEEEMKLEEHAREAALLRR